MDNKTTTPNKEKTQDSSPFKEKSATPEPGKRISQYQAMMEAADTEMDGAILTVRRLIEEQKQKTK